MATRLLLQWSCGNVSAVEVQRLAHGAVLDGLLHEEVAQLASLGAWGEQPGNINRDLKRLHKCDLLPEPLIVRVPCLAEKALPAVVAHCDVAIMLPHQWVAGVAAAGEAERLLGIQWGPSFWDAVSPEDPRLLARGGHPVKQVESYRDCVIPLWLHGDGVEYAENQSFMALSFGSVLSTTSSMDSMFWMAGFVKSATARADKGHGADTWNTIWQILCWSLSALWEGACPTRNWLDQPFEVGSAFARDAGKPIWKGYRFCIWNLIGDFVEVEARHVPNETTDRVDRVLAAKGRGLRVEPVV